MSQSQEPVPVNRPIRLVIAEDNALLRGVLRDALIGAGFVVLGEAADGVAAVSLIDEGIIPDVVLMNGKMPHWDGWEATTRISQSHPDLPVLIHTAGHDWRAIERSRASGARGLIKSGVSLEEFTGAIRTLAAGGEYWPT